MKIEILLVLFLINNACSLYQRPCKIPSLRNGKIRQRQRGRAVKYICNPGYVLAGDRTAFCRNGEWDATIPKCVRATCVKKIPTLNHGIALQSVSGGVVRFYCQEGFKLNGPENAYCDGTNWDTHNPSCMPSEETPKLFCDFEDDDICHWTHDIDHDMNWIRDAYKTPTGYSMATGPSYDHTKGENANGHYMYIESSSRRPNDTARLVSPIFGKLEGTICLEFWYHMYGKTTGTLRAYVRKTSDSWPPNPKTAIFSKSGEQGNRWLRAIIEVGQYDGDIQVVMEGVRGNGYVSDIAIDDVKLIPDCTYEDHIWTTTTEDTMTTATEMEPVIGSCENRCGVHGGSNDCDCDYMCHENHTCCPDFIDMCIDQSTFPDEDTSTTTVASTIQHSTPSQLIPLPLLTTKKPNQVILLPPQTTPAIIVKKPLSTTTMKNKVILLPSPVTPTIIRKLLITTTKKPTTEKMGTLDWINKSSIVSTNKSDVIPTANETSTIQNVESNEINYNWNKEKSIEKEFKLVENDNVGEIKTDFRQIAVDEDGSPKMFTVIETLGALVVLVVIVVIIVVSIRRRHMRSRSRMNGGQGDSQSDVRFLTADEVLDFSITSEDL